MSTKKEAQNAPETPIVPSPAAAPATVTLDLAALQALIDAEVSKRMSGMTPPDHLAKRMQEAAKLEAKEEELIPSKSIGTEATFLARVIKSRTFPNGRVVELIGYEHPDGVDRHASDRNPGRVPDGMPIFQPGPEGPTAHKSIQWKQWRYTEFWQKDLRDLIGKPFHRLYRREDAAYTQTECEALGVDPSAAIKAAE